MPENEVTPVKVLNCPLVGQPCVGFDNCQAGALSDEAEAAGRTEKDFCLVVAKYEAEARYYDSQSDLTELAIQNAKKQIGQ